MINNDLLQECGHAVVDTGVDTVGNRQIKKVGILKQPFDGWQIAGGRLQHCGTRQGGRKRRFLSESCKGNQTMATCRNRQDFYRLW